jgi:predicted phage tail protein
MTTTYGAINGHSRIRFTYTTTNISNTVTRVAVSAYLEMVDGWSSAGTWPWSYTGQWGASNGSYSTSLGTNGSLLLKSGSYDIARGSSDSSVTFQLKAQNYTGYPTATISVPIPEKITVPPAPTFLGLSSITNTSMVARFSGNGDGGSAITKWELQYSTSSSFSSATTVTSSGTSTITGLTPKTTYYFRARGVNAVGAGSWSAVDSDKTYDIPGGVTNTVVGGSLDHDSVQISFSGITTNGSAITNYELQLSTSSSFSSIAQSATGTGVPPTKTWSGLSRLKTYYHRARVKNAYGWGPYTSLSFTTTGQVPSAPSDYTASDVASTTAYFTLPTVSDDGGLSLTSWQYKLNTVASDTGATTSAVSTEYIAPFLQGLTQGTTYYFKMLVINGLGSSAYGPWVSFTTRADVPTPPTSTAVSLITNTTAKVTWGAPANLLGSTLWGYTVRLSQNAAFSKGLLEYTSDDGSLAQVLNGLLPGTNYYVQVNAISANGPGSYSPIVSFKTTGTAPVPQDFWMRVAGTWKGGNLFLRVAGVWKPVTVWQRVDGTWRKN